MAPAVGRLLEEVVSGGPEVTMTVCMACPSEPVSGPGDDRYFVTGVGSVVAMYQELLEVAKADILAYLHNDVEIYDPDWPERVLAEFSDPSVGLIGFGGALRHGSPDLYRSPYRLQNLARYGYLSNTTDAEQHGQRFTGACDVAVLDGFALIVRRVILERAWHQDGMKQWAGWPVHKLIFHNYDYWLCGVARRQGYRIRMVGVSCLHKGGQTSTKPAYQDWLRERGLTDEQTHADAHRWLWDEMRDVLPWEVRA